ncbi:hypothetical protein [Amycolatopsis vancoresmycina]|uniref:Secreted protein n=1 Tax=Amycolatopsis vancoresmycina DSM 44592 TaxID=1292037 RepID=R1FRN1_9PSEU|nr:hypothetical protein [Amycolatopsis vancoresmycina]EOD62087.1 hypothetical protein H480_40125 [Amycolatopsis vancoresmycina DSM 44592]
MRRKWIVFSIAVLSLFGLSAGPAAASGRDFAPPGCFGERYGILFGQGVSVSCFPGTGYGYRVLAHCTSGSAFWFVAGLPVPYGFGPAVAECSGDLLVPARLVAYQVDEI